MAEKERQSVMSEGWLEDRLGLLTNFYVTLMQAEVDRYQDTVSNVFEEERINQRNRSDLEISRTNLALTSSNSRIKPKTYGLCVPNLVKKWQL